MGILVGMMMAVMMMGAMVASLVGLGMEVMTMGEMTGLEMTTAFPLTGMRGRIVGAVADLLDIRRMDAGGLGGFDFVDLHLLL